MFPGGLQIYIWKFIEEKEKKICWCDCYFLFDQVERNNKTYAPDSKLEQAGQPLQPNFPEKMAQDDDDAVRVKQEPDYNVS